MIYKNFSYLSFNASIIFDLSCLFLFSSSCYPDTVSFRDVDQFAVQYYSIITNRPCQYCTLVQRRIRKAIIQVNIALVIPKPLLVPFKKHKKNGLFGNLWSEMRVLWTKIKCRESLQFANFSGNETFRDVDWFAVQYYSIITNRPCQYCTLVQRRIRKAIIQVNIALVI